MSSIVLIALFFFMLLNTVYTASNNDIQQSTTPLLLWKKNRPRQFRMQVFSRPNSKGAVQTIRAINSALSTSCWNLASKRVGSYELNDPLIKVTFYRSSDCHGASSATFYNHQKQSHILIKAKSVSITKVKPILLKDQQIISLE